MLPVVPLANSVELTNQLQQPQTNIAAVHLQD